MSVCVIVCVVTSSLSGQSEWLAEEMKSEKKVQYMVKHYSDFQKRMKTQGKREKYSVAVLKESLKASEIVEVDDQGEMMNETQFMEWKCNDPKGPKNSIPAAQAEWKLMEDNPSTCGVLSDVKHEKKRFRVETRTLVSYKTQMTREKALELESQRIKNPTGDSIAAMEASVKTRHDQMASGGTMNFQLQAQGMLSAGQRGNSFDGAAALLGDIQKVGFQEEGGEEEEEGGDDKKKETEGDGKESGGEEPPTKKAKYFNTEQQSLSMQRDLEKQLLEKMKSIRKVKDDLSKAMAGLQNGSPSHIQPFKAEVALAKPRLKRLEAVLESQAAVEAYKASFRPVGYKSFADVIVSSPQPKASASNTGVGVGSPSTPGTTGAGLAGSPAPSSPLQSPGPGSVSTCTQMSRVAPIPSIECLMSEAHLNELIQEESATITSADMKSERMKEVRVLFVPLADLEKEGTQAFNSALWSA